MWDFTIYCQIFYGVSLPDFNSFHRSGLAHPTLARIWAHVDVEKSGRLNLEQYAKCVLLIRECQQPQQQDGTTAEASSPPPMLPPPAGGLGRRDSQISTNSVGEVISTGIVIRGHYLFEEHRHIRYQNGTTNCGRKSASSGINGCN